VKGLDPDQLRQQDRPRRRGRVGQPVLEAGPRPRGPGGLPGGLEAATGRVHLPGQGQGQRPGFLVFGGIVNTDQGISGHLGLGVFRADSRDRIVDVASPGDAAPGGRVFDNARNPTINSRGDVAFGGHLRGDECIDFGVSQDDQIACAESVFLKQAGSGRILQIAHQGDPIPDSAGGGVFHYAFGPTVNDAREVVFTGAMSDPPGPVHGDSLGVFLCTDGRVIKVARPGDALPGGGHLLTTSDYVSNYDLNGRGQVTFNAALREGGEGLYFRGSAGTRPARALRGVLPGRF
jgi:hypothetical protein